MSGLPDDWAASNDHYRVVSSVNGAAANTGQILALAAPKSKKATKHRKRHIPVGPAGVLFQQTQQQQQPRPGAKRQRVRGGADDENYGKNGNNTTEKHRPDENLDSSSDDEGSISTAARRNHEHHHPHQSPRTVSASAYTSPAWTAAHCVLQLCTPSYPFHWTSLQKYEALRPQLPPEYLLIPELRNGAADWHMAPSQKLLVQILTVQAVTGSNDHLWTVTMTDESGATLQAWLSPEWVRHEQQQTLAQQKIRTGSLWLLENCAVQLIASNQHSITNISAEEDDEDEEEEQQQQQHDRMLLVALENVVQVWHSNASVTNDEYIQWMEARNALTANMMSRCWSVGPSSQLASDDDDDNENEGGPLESVRNNSIPLNPAVAPSLSASPMSQGSTLFQQHQARQLTHHPHAMRASPLPPSQHQATDTRQQQCRTGEKSSRPPATRAIVSHSQPSIGEVTNSRATCRGASRTLTQKDRPPPMDTPIPQLNRTTTTTPPISSLRRPSHTPPAEPLSSHGTTQSIDFTALRANKTHATVVARHQMLSSEGHPTGSKPRMQPTNLAQSPATRVPIPPATAAKKNDTATQPRTTSSQKRRQRKDPSSNHASLQNQPLWSTTNPDAFLMHGFSSDEDGEEDTLGKSSNGICSGSTPLPQLQPRAKENDPPAKPSSVSDVNSTTDNHHAKQAPSMVLLFQESAYAKLCDLDEMFDDDDDDDNIV